MEVKPRTDCAKEKNSLGDFAEPNAPTRALALSTDDRGHACA